MPRLPAGHPVVFFVAFRPDAIRPPLFLAPAASRPSGRFLLRIPAGCHPASIVPCPGCLPAFVRCQAILSPSHWPPYPLRPLGGRPAVLPPPLSSVVPAVSRVLFRSIAVSPAIARSRATASRLSRVPTRSMTAPPATAALALCLSPATLPSPSAAPRPRPAGRFPPPAATCRPFASVS